MVVGERAASEPKPSEGPVSRLAGIEATDAAYEWEVVVISAREKTPVLAETLRAAAEASAGRARCIDVVVNGRRLQPQDVEALLAVTRGLTDSGRLTVRVWNIPLGDKANAINGYFQTMSTGHCPVFFLDGYARPQRAALELLAEALVRNPGALAAAAVPTVGPSAAALRSLMLRRPGLHGNLFALAPAAVQGFRDAQVRLPVGVYRTDAIMAAIIAFNFVPSVHKWEWTRIIAVPEATWSVPPSGSAASVVRAVLSRRLRQAQGVLEMAAVREQMSVKRRPATALPATARDLVCGWIAEKQIDALRVGLSNPLALYVAFRLWRSRPDAAPSATPELVGHAES